MSTPPAAGLYGGFDLGGMPLALPIAALREVLPCTVLSPLPCPQASLLGGLSLRGTLLPVLDLCRLMGRMPQPVDPAHSVVVLAHGGRLLGLLASRITGLFEAAPPGPTALHATDALAALLAASLRRADTGQLVSVLDPAALARLPDLPWLDDPEPQRRRAEARGDHEAPAADAADDAADAPAVTDDCPLLLVRSGEHYLALDAMQVHATLTVERLQPSVLARGACRGLLPHAGQDLPAVDLAAWCGLDEAVAAEAPGAAFVLRMPGGLLACLVDQVLDVVRVPRHTIVPLPPHALRRRTLFAGALDFAALPDELRQRLPPRAQGLVLSASGLAAADHLAELASFAQGRAGRSQADPRNPAPTGARVPPPAAAGQGAPPATSAAMVTFVLDQETATPIEQIQEILLYDAQRLAPRRDGAMLGLLVHRGRSLPVVCLSRLAGLPAPARLTSLLVVEAQGVSTAFAVPALRSIEPSDWQPRLRTPGPRTDSLAQALGSRRMAQVGGAGQPRLLRVLDLQEIAQALQDSALAA